jgi:hypothetical protein
VGPRTGLDAVENRNCTRALYDKLIELCEIWGHHDTVTITVLCDVTQCSLVDTYQCFRRTDTLNFFFKVRGNSLEI